MGSHFENDSAVEAFLKAVGAEPSVKPRRFGWIYWVYLKYTILNNIEPLSRIQFSMSLTKMAKSVMKHRHEAKYFIDCELFNLKYEDQIALKEYKKEEHKWQLEERKRRKSTKERSKSQKRRWRLKKEKERAIRDLKSDSFPELNKNTTITITSNPLALKKENG